MTGPDRTWAAMYRPGDVVQYERGSKAEGLKRGSFGVVRSRDTATNRLTVSLPNGSNVEYDPKRVYGVNVYRETSREFATGDRLQFSAIYKDLGISNRDMATITRSRTDSPYSWTAKNSAPLASIPLSSGSLTTATLSHPTTNRPAYVAISRASEDARIYTNDAATLGQRLATDVTKTAALDLTGKPGPP